MKLSAVMQTAVNTAKQHGGELELWRGGFWTYPGCPSTHAVSDFDGKPQPVPSWYVGTTTIHALLRRGAIEFTERTERGFPIRAKIVE
jgi:hypothetical protein